MLTKLIMGGLIAASLISSPVIGEAKYPQYHVMPVEDTVQTMVDNDIQFKTQTDNEKIISFVEHLSVIADTMSKGARDKKSPFIISTVYSIDAFANTSGRIYLLTDYERNVVQSAMDNWKIGDWSNVENERKELMAIVAKYNH